MIIQPAQPNDHEALTQLTIASKGHWGYSEKQLNDWHDQLSITSSYIETNSVYKLMKDRQIIGYYSYFHKANDIVKLDNLFVSPQHIGHGYGKKLMADFLTKLESTIRKVIVDSDPNAEGFYAKVGFIKTGHIETSTPNRYLPVMMLELS